MCAALSVYNICVVGPPVICGMTRSSAMPCRKEKGVVGLRDSQTTSMEQLRDMLVESIGGLRVLLALGKSAEAVVCRILDTSAMM